MKTYCIVKDNIVENVIVCPSDTVANELGAVYLGEQPVIGDLVENGIIPAMSTRVKTHTESLAISIRTQRDELLKDTDWWALSDHTMTAQQAAYRQALRDLPQQDGFPDNVIYPTKP